MMYCIASYPNARNKIIDMKNIFAERLSLCPNFCDAIISYPPTNFYLLSFSCGIDTGKSINVLNDEDVFKEKLSEDIKLNNEKTKVSETSEDIIKSAKEGESNETKWAGDDISNEKLELIRKISGLTKEEIQVVMQKSKEEALNSGKESNRRNRTGIYGNDINSEEELEDFMTLSTKLNLVVYVVLILAIIYFLNRDYNNLATIWFTTTFPREAATLGIEIPQKN